MCSDLKCFRNVSVRFSYTAKCAILHTIPKNTIRIGTIPNGHNSEWTPSRMDTIPNCHHPEWTPSRMVTIPNGHHPEWTPSRMDTIPNGHNSKWTQSRMDTIPNGTIPNRHYPESTRSRMIPSRLSTYMYIVTLVFYSYCLVKISFTNI